MAASACLAAVTAPAFAQEEAQSKLQSTVPASGADNGPPSVAAFAQLPFVEGAKLSPDGLWVAGMFAIGGSQRVVVVSPFEPGSMKQAILPDDTEISSLHWVGNENVLIRLRAIRPFDAGERAYISRVVAFNRVTPKFTKLLWDMGGQDASDVLWVPSDGTTKVLIAAQNSIYLGKDFWPAVYSVDVTNGRRTTDLEGRTDVMDWIADPTGVVRMAIATDRERGTRSLLYRPRKGAAFDRAGRADYDSLEVPVLVRAAEGKALVIRTIGGEADAPKDAKPKRDALLEIDLATGNTVQTLYEAGEGVDIDGVRYDDAGNDVLGVYLGGRSSEPLHWLDPALDELQKAFEKSLNGRRARIVSLSTNRQRMLVRVDKANEAGRLYYYDMADGSLRLFANLNSETNGKKAAKVEAMTYKARDGLEIEAIVTTPPGREAKNLPVVIMPHGGPWAHDTLDWDYWAQFIASRGYLVIQPNFRGSTGYGEAFLKKGEGQLGFAMQDDVNDALAWAAKQGMANAKRACVVGASYGGYVAMWGAARDADLWRCSVSIAGVANLRREVNDFGGALYSKRYKEEWQKMTPNFPAVSPINFIDRIKAPMLLVHGKKDLTVDHAQSQSMFGKMKAAGKDVEFVSLPQADHYFSRTADREALLGAIEGFLRKHNPAD
ncbi:S9 family peptidase [Novosphingobium sp. ERN07]|uniref:alpha/beta hydrolase family protein n=1 Tax=Novosphingobium sp. ERN07 TaxID=2726187 RepID=UPI0014568452|nr:prolyl oligopeptidase family serine peptidase [Novosphingobium sp. ERN07]NLR71519.1 S9 family peptidase [Novosphingobium sp. ERN07]